MRCPHCGADIVEDVLVCPNCNARLEPRSARAVAGEHLAQTSVAVSSRGTEEQGVKAGNASAEDLQKTVIQEALGKTVEVKRTNPQSIGGSVPGIVPVDNTIVRPRAKQSGDDHLYVRNTRDYDHDAQSVNTVVNTRRFDTITEKRSRFDGWRDPYARSSRDGRTPGEGNSTSKTRPLLALLLVLVVLGGGGAVLSYGMELWGGKTVPYMVGDSQYNAEQKLAAQGLVAHVEAQPADDAIGKVLSQSIQSGTRVPEGSEVTLVVATNRTIPEVVGLTEGEARSMLEATGADQIEVQPRPSVDAVGMVLEVVPAVGTPFVSRSAVTLYVGVPYTVPNLVGMKEADALEMLSTIGYAGEVHYVASDATVRTVVETSPAFNEVLPVGSTVQVVVSSPYPTSPLHLAEFFNHASQDDNAYLQREGYAFERGFIESAGNAVTSYASGENGTFTFTPQPYARSVSWPQEGSANVLETGAPFVGVRFDFPTWQAPTTCDRATVESLAAACGFGSLVDFCDNASMKVPAGSKGTASATFACASGKTDGLAWTVLVVVDHGVPRASATCARESVYKSSDMAPFGGSVCRYVAYQDVYLSASYQPKMSAEKPSDAKTAG